MNATYQPCSASGAAWQNPSNALGAQDGASAINSAGTGLLVLSQSGFAIPAGYVPVGFLFRLVAGTADAPVTTTYGGGYKQELANANTPTNGLVNDFAEGDEATYIEATNTGSGPIVTESGGEGV